MDPAGGDEDRPSIMPDGVEDDDQFRAHSAVEVNTVGYREFAPSVECVTEVRRFVEETLVPAGIDGLRVFECQLVADELAANAVRHAQSVFSVAVELTDAFVRIAVRDESSELPVERGTQVESLHGRGLAIVSGTASGWGTVMLGRGKETWADIMRTAS